jgi:phytanoyl-CoA hydroxylase
MLLLGNQQFFIHVPENPNNEKQNLGWHQDSSYFKNFPHSDSLVCWFPLFDVDDTNGALWVIPGSHRLGQLPHIENKFGEHKDMAWDKRGRVYIDSGLFAEHSAVQVPIKRGSVGFFHFDLIHKSGLTNKKPRYTFLSRYGNAKSLDFLSRYI